LAYLIHLTKWIIYILFRVENLDLNLIYLTKWFERVSSSN